MPVMKACPEPGCGTPVIKGRCDKHRRQHEQRRGSRQKRGYDTAYDREHRAYQRRMNNGERFICWRCKAEQGIEHEVDPRPGRWHLGHDDVDRSIIRGPECPPGNLATARKSVSYPGG